MNRRKFLFSLMLLTGGAVVSYYGYKYIKTHQNPNFKELDSNKGLIFPSEADLKKDKQFRIYHCFRTILSRAYCFNITIISFSNSKVQKTLLRN